MVIELNDIKPRSISERDNYYNRIKMKEKNYRSFEIMASKITRKKSLPSVIVWESQFIGLRRWW